MPASPDAIGLSLITAVQRHIDVRVRRAASAVAWSRSHLVCHWLEDLLPPNPLLSVARSLPAAATPSSPSTASHAVPAAAARAQLGSLMVITSMPALRSAVFVPVF